MKRPGTERPIFPGKLTPRKNIYDERGVSPVIAVILMVAITVVLSAVLYVMVQGIITPPKPLSLGTLRFEEDDDEPTKYIGQFEGSIELDDVEIRVVDKSETKTILLRPSKETSKEVPGGLNITYDDVNSDNYLNVADTLVIFGGENGDEISIIDMEADKTAASIKLK
jgi:flagellin-like protein